MLFSNCHVAEENTWGYGMHLGKLGAATSVVAMVWSVPALAGDEVLYSEPPAWIAPVDIDAAIEKGEDIVLYDRQIRLDGGVVTRYSDVAYDIGNTQSLQDYGTLQFSWLPDKGDLTFHRLELIRDGQVIDLIAQGVKPEVIRRERDLEKRSVDGELTAVVAVPGMAVGDVLRMATSTTLRDQALHNEMQVTEGFVTEPTKLGYGRMRISWPVDGDVRWGTMGDVDPLEVTQQGRDNLIEVSLPIEKPDEMPGDAPARYRVNPLIQLGTFASWKELSQVMAPHFETQGSIEPGGEIAGHVARIMATTDKPLERAALALRVVQDEISYLANGMNGGNYLPQMPQETWDLRFGDCKAKSVLLLAMLREMGIKAEVVLVDSDFGDAASISEPVPGAFDHMIVRAMIDGSDYWLDGTDAGARLETIHEVPNFTWALPLRTEGADLVKMEQRWPIVPDRTYHITYDMRAGVDLPALYEIEMEARGSIGAQLRPLANETDPRELLGHANGYFDDQVDGVVYEAEYSYDEEQGIAHARVKGLSFNNFQLERDTASFAVSGATTGWGFNPDRARSSWREIPFKIGGPYTVSQSVTYLLPDDGKGAQVEGVTTLDTVAAGTKFHRESGLNGGTFRISDQTSYIPGEIAASDIRAGKTAIRRIASGDPKIKISDPTRFWELADREIANRMEVFELAADRLTEVFEDEAQMYLVRAFVSIFGRDYETAVDELDQAIELGASADAYGIRSVVFANMNQTDRALADAESAFDLQGDVNTASTLAQLLARVGKGDEALELIDSLGLSGDEAVSAMAVWSELSGYAGRQEEAWLRIEDLLFDRPEDVTLLNSKCWLAGIWSYNLDMAEPVCNQAVTLSGHSAGVIDSRALVHYRLGKFDAALEDIDAALSKEPGLAASRYLRGIIRLEQGDKKGREDIVAAKRISPDIEHRYAAFGLTVK